MTQTAADAAHAATLDAIRTLATAGDWHGIIRACSGSNHSTLTHFWALAMTAHFGPVGLHQSRCGADGRPDPVQCSDVPRVFTQMAEAGAEICRLIGVNPQQAVA